MKWEKLNRRILQAMAAVTGLFAVWAAAIGATANSLDIELTALMFVVALSIWFVTIITYLYDR